MSESLVSSSSQMGRTRRRGARPIQAQDASENIDRRQLLSALTRLKRGDFTVRLDEAHSGVDGKISDAFNQVVELNQRISVELARLCQLVGKEGRISERASLGDVQGSPGGITLVALTGCSSADDLHRIVSSGFDDYLVKPISFDRVEALVAAKLAHANRPVPDEPRR